MLKELYEIFSLDACVCVCVNYYQTAEVANLPIWRSPFDLSIITAFSLKDDVALTQLYWLLPWVEGKKSGIRYVVGSGVRVVPLPAFPIQMVDW